MSLLLDALKKSGSSTPPGDKTGKFNAPDLSELTLEELPQKSSSAADETTTAQAGSMANSSPRSTGENLFAAKRAPSPKKFQYNLGIIPTAIIIGLVLGTAGGIYVWVEIQPPKAAQFIAPPPASLASNHATPAPRAIQPLALPPETTAQADTKPKIVYSPPATENRARPGRTKRAPTAENEGGIQVQRQMENDGIFATLTAAYQAYQSGDLNTAWQRYREVLRKDAKNRDALLGIAAIAQQQGQDEIAIQHYKQVLVLDPRDPVAQAGMTALSGGDAIVKESRLKLSLSQTPQSASLYFALGNLYTEQSRWGDAQQAYANALKVEPGNAQFAFNLATSMDHLGRKSQAAQYYQQALQLDTTGNAGFDRAQTEQRMKQLQAP